MRTKQIPIVLPEHVRIWYQRNADQLGIPIATYVRMRLTEVYVTETQQRDPQATPAAPAAALSATDGPDLNNAW